MAVREMLSSLRKKKRLTKERKVLFKFMGLLPTRQETVQVMSEGTFFMCRRDKPLPFQGNFSFAETISIRKEPGLLYPILFSTALPLPASIKNIVGVTAA